MSLKRNRPRKKAKHCSCSGPFRQPGGLAPTSREEHQERRADGRSNFRSLRPLNKAKKNTPAF